MPNPTWPTTLPHPEYGLSEGDVDNMIVRSNNDAGVSKQRLRYTAVAVPLSGQFTLSRAQYAIFDAFVKTTLKYVLPFDTVDYMTDTGTKTYRFVKRPKASRASFDQVTVTFEMERMP